MRRRYLGDGWDLVKVRGTRFNTGVMLDRAMAAGAQSFGHIGGCHSSPQDMHAPDVGDLNTHNQTSRYSYPFSIMVNVEGRRFMDEGEDLFALTYAKTGNEIRKQPQGIAYQIFDQKALHLLEPRYKTSRAVVADTIEDLAGALRIDPAALTRHRRRVQCGLPTGRVRPLRQGRPGHDRGIRATQVELGAPCRSGTVRRPRRHLRDHLHLWRRPHRPDDTGSIEREPAHAESLRHRRDRGRAVLA